MRSRHRAPLLALALLLLSSSDRAALPRAYGIFVGISTYKSGEALAYCADDALRVSRFFAALAGPLNVPPDRAIVLTDSAATLEAMKKAFAATRARLEPDDVFVFYFSGHGGGPDEPDAPPLDEPDGHDETIVPWDADGSHKADLSDDQFRQILDGFPNRDRIIILDACFSGGFVPDLARDGTLVLAATQENRSSMVAYAHRISGALTHALLTGLSGAADADGDSSVTQAELTRYLGATMPRYCQACGRRNPPGRSRCYYDREPLDGPASHPAFGGRVSLSSLATIRVPYRPDICASPEERRACARRPADCRCEVKGECGEAECMTIGRKATDRCATAGERDACRRSSELCPCPDFGNCRMTCCTSPDEPVCTKEDDRAQCERNPEQCPCGHFGDCEMASCARLARRQ